MQPTQEPQPVLPEHPAPQPQQWTPEAPVSEPLQQQPQCAKAFDQCGGDGDWTGPTCCEEGRECKMYNPQYSQCVPGTFLAAGGPDFAQKFGGGAAVAAERRPAAGAAAVAALCVALLLSLVAAAALLRRPPLRGRPAQSARRYEHLGPRVRTPPSGTETESQG